ncbi:glycosyltransferase family 2 protein [Longispora sp. NPDC051575]|uniref:glycosyltransferase family 2 protein n=1 Tax=Longispora sp. NPDC051575 TaxID=3154943 RepID=UPI003438046C
MRPLLTRRTPRGVDPTLTAEFRIPGELRLPTQRSTGPLRPAYAPVPLPPTDDEKYVHRKRRLVALMLASLVSFTCLTVSQVLFLRMSPWLLLFTPLLGFTIVYYVISFVVNVGTRDFDMRAHSRLVAGWRPEKYPSVDVFLPICGEPAHVVGNTWACVRKMVARYPGEIRVHVLDDSPDDGLRRTALGFGFRYLRRPNRGWFKKAGNMRHAFERTDHDFILVLDADFAPRADMLEELLPYFDDAPDLGIVQSPQYFRVHKGQGWLERGAGTVQELFYRSVQVSRQHHGAAICVGSCAVYRRAALDAIGGTALIEHSEDVHTGFNLRVEGWGLRYVPVVLAAGLCPSNVDSFFTQQYRWCAGSMSLLSSRKFWRTKLSLRARLSYVSGFCYYVHTGLYTLVTPALPLVLLAVFPSQIAVLNYVLIIPSIIYNLAVVPLWHRTPYGVDVFTVKLIYGWAHMFAVWDILRGRPMGWQPTGGTAKKDRTRRLWHGLRFWTTGLSLAWVGLAGARMFTGPPLDYVPMFLSGMFALLIALQSLLVKPTRDIEVIA